MASGTKRARAWSSALRPHGTKPVGFLERARQLYCYRSGLFINFALGNCVVSSASDWRQESTNARASLETSATLYCRAFTDCCFDFRRRRTFCQRVRTNLKRRLTVPSSKEVKQSPRAAMPYEACDPPRSSRTISPSQVGRLLKSLLPRILTETLPSWMWQ